MIAPAIVNAINAPSLYWKSSSTVEFGSNLAFEAYAFSTSSPLTVLIEVTDNNNQVISKVRDNFQVNLNSPFDDVKNDPYIDYLETIPLTKDNYKTAGNYELVFISYNGIDGYRTTSIPFTVTQPIDQPAVWQTLTNKEINEDSPAGTIVYQGLKTLCNDPDNDEIVTVTSQHSYYSLYFDNNDLKIRNLELNYNGIETVGLS